MEEMTKVVAENHFLNYSLRGFMVYVNHCLVGQWDDNEKLCSFFETAQI